MSQEQEALGAFVALLGELGLPDPVRLHFCRGEPAPPGNESIEARMPEREHLFAIGRALGADCMPSSPRSDLKYRFWMSGDLPDHPSAPRPDGAWRCWWSADLHVKGWLRDGQRHIAHLHVGWHEERVAYPPEAKSL